MSLDVADDASESLKAAQAAFEARDWAAVVAHLQAEDARAPLDAPQLQVLAQASLLTGTHEDTSRALERAMEAYEAAGDRDRSAQMAVALWRVHNIRSETSVAAGWLRRAERLIEGEQACPGRAHVEAALATMCQFRGDPEGAKHHGQEAARIGRACGDVTTEALGLSRLGCLHISMGEVEEGRALLDEAMVLVSSRSLDAVCEAVVYCNTIEACKDLGDYDRASEWTERATALTQERHAAGFPGICRVHRASLLRLRGRFEDARREVDAAAEVLSRFDMRLGVALAFSEEGTLLLQGGDLEGARRAFDRAREFGYAPEPGLSLIKLRDGDAAGALRSLSRAVREEDQDALARAKLLPAMVEIALAAEDGAAAAQAADDLRDIALHYASAGLRASAQLAQAEVALSRGQADDAIGCASKAVRAWVQLDAPYEAARAREVLARAYELGGDADDARREREAARRTRATLVLSPSAADPALAETASGPAAEEVAPTMPPAAGDELGDKIELGAPLGRGGMGEVRAGRHRITGRRVAVKRLHAALCADAAQRQRFLNEAKACGAIKHDHVVDVYDAGFDAGAPYIVMEMLQGESLAERIERVGPLPVDEAVRWAKQAALGVGAAHAAGVIHRDLKPDNLFVERSDDGTERLKVLDFGISKVGVDCYLRAQAVADTAPGTLLGTPLYMSPEQAQGVDDLDLRTDVYSLGAVLYEMLAGKPPFDAAHHAEVLVRILREPFPRIAAARTDVPPELAAVVDRATARHRDVRLPDMGALHAALQAVG